MAASAGLSRFDEYKLKAVASFLRKGKPEGAIMIIDSGLDVNKQLFGNATLLMAAAEGGCKDMVTMLLNKGLDPNAITVDKNTPLSYASDPDIVRMLLDAKANATIGPALHMSCVKHQPASVQMLLEARASVAAVGCRRSPLYTVIEHNASDDKIDDKIATINLLLDAGARTVKMNRDDDSALHLAATAHCPGTPRALEVLVAREPLLGECRNDSNRSPLMSAIEYGTIQSIKTLVGAGVDVDAKISNGMTVLHLALFPTTIWEQRRGVRQRMRDIIRILLDAGASPLECATDGRTAVMMLFMTNPKDEAKYIIADNATSVFIRDFATFILFPTHVGNTPRHTDHWGYRAAE
jgi:ankyrin repeat protein